MPNILPFIQGYAALPNNEKKTRLTEILAQKQVIESLFFALSSDKSEKTDQRNAAAVLCDISNKEKFKRQIFNTLSPAFAKQLLGSEDPKLRKSIAKLMGSANNKRYASVLVFALEAEETEFVLESLILALGYTDYSRDAYDYLSTYQLKSTEEKHRVKEEQALQKALSSLKKSAMIDEILLQGTPVLLTYPDETPNALKQELTEAGVPFSESASHKSALVVSPEKYTDVFAFRCFFEALIDLGTYNRDAKHAYLDAILRRIDVLIGIDAYQIRFDLRYLNPADKSAAMKMLVENLHDTKFSSSPSNYQLELRLMFQKNAVQAYMCLPNLDTRFAYRKQTLPASIHPVIAANIMRTIRPYLTDDATVLDPFCGVGTLLYERDMILPCEELVGVDIKKDAIYKAKVNFLNDDIPIAFLVSDILSADLDQTFDEVFANMPFGRRVSDTKSNEVLYTGFVQQLKLLLKKDGYAFLYTNQKAFLRNLIKGDMCFTLD